jgi:adenine-specific DNA-methyltransferase
LCFTKNIENANINGKDIETANFTLSDEYENERGKYSLTDLDRVCSKTSFQYQETLDYEIEAPDGTLFKNCRNDSSKGGTPKSYCYTLGKPLFD